MTPSPLPPPAIPPQAMLPVAQKLPPAISLFARDGKVLASSKEVAEMFGKQHAHVMRDIDALIVEAGGISNFGETPWTNPQNGQTYRQYEMDRDGFTLLAMGFTGSNALKFKMAYIAEFNRMEAVLRGPVAANLNDPATLRGLLGDYAGKVESLTADVAVFQPKAEAFDKIAASDDDYTPQQAAKLLDMAPHAFIAWLRDAGWLYRNKNRNVAMQSKIDAGLMRQKYNDKRGCLGEKSPYQAYITPAGVAKLRLIFNERKAA